MAVKTRINVSLTQEDLDAIDAARKKTGQNRSEFMVEGSRLLAEVKKPRSTKAAIRKIMEIARRAVP